MARWQRASAPPSLPIVWGSRRVATWCFAGCGLLEQPCRIRRELFRKSRSAPSPGDSGRSPAASNGPSSSSSPSSSVRVSSPRGGAFRGGRATWLGFPAICCSMALWQASGIAMGMSLPLANQMAHGRYAFISGGHHVKVGVRPRRAHGFLRDARNLGSAAIRASVACACATHPALPCRETAPVVFGRGQAVCKRPRRAQALAPGSERPWNGRIARSRLCASALPLVGVALHPAALPSGSWMKTTIA